MTPSWLKSVQNGQIGEARVRAFLLERFWLLDRTVDIHGADFIIQRRIYEKNVLDPEPPRFGVVQAKFSQDENTYHYVRSDYVVDKEGKPRTEFFLIITTGFTDSQRMFLLTAKNIMHDFRINCKDSFAIPSRKVFENKKFEVLNRTISLDIMEVAIKNAEFNSNRLFVFPPLPEVNVDLTAISPAYLPDMEHRFGQVSDLFRQKKEEAYGALVQLGDAYDLFRQFLESTDPIEACYIAEKIHYQFGQQINLPEVFSRDFYYDTQWHKTFLELLSADGLLANYVKMEETIGTEINGFLSQYPGDAIFDYSSHVITIEYDLNTFSVIEVFNEIVENAVYEGFSRFQLAIEGKVVYMWKVGLLNRQETIITMNEVCLRDIMRKVYLLKYFEDGYISAD